MSDYLKTMLQEKETKLLVYFLLITGIFLPGFFFIFIFARDLFFKLDIVRLLMLASVISIPFFTANSIFSSLFLDHLIEKLNSRMRLDLSFGSLFSIFVFLILGAMYYFRLLDVIDIKAGLIALIIIQLSWLLIIFLIGKVTRPHKMNIKKIIAREGLIILLTLVFGLFLIFLYHFFHPANSNVPYALFGQKVYQYDLMIANRFLFFGITLIGLYVVYLVIRFIIWAIKTLKEK